MIFKIKYIINMGFEIILNGVQDNFNENSEYRKAKYSQRRNNFNIDFYGNFNEQWKFFHNAHEDLMGGVERVYGI